MENMKPIVSKIILPLLRWNATEESLFKNDPMEFVMLVNDLVD